MLLHCSVVVFDLVFITCLASSSIFVVLLGPEWSPL